MSRSIASFFLAGVILSITVFLGGAAPLPAATPDFDQEDTIRAYIALEEYAASAYEQTVADKYNQQYRCREIVATAAFTDFSGTHTLMELELFEPATVGFQIAADIAGDYKVVVVSGGTDILMTASSFQWQAASRPIEIPAGRLEILLVGESATGALQVDLHPPADATLIIEEEESLTAESKTAC